MPYAPFKVELRALKGLNYLGSVNPLSKLIDNLKYFTILRIFFDVEERIQLTLWLT